MQTNMRRVRVVVLGRVQGVWFRDSVREHAVAVNVSGWASNRTDGSVEAVFEGDDDSVASCIRFCEVGPPRAVVSSVEIFDEEPGAEPSGTFEVRQG